MKQAIFSSDLMSSDNRNQVSLYLSFLLLWKQMILGSANPSPLNMDDSGWNRLMTDGVQTVLLLAGKEKINSNMTITTIIINKFIK